MPSAEAVIVGVDGSPASDEAIRWAATRAQHTGGHLRLLHAYTVPVTLPVLPLAGEAPYGVEPVDYTRAAEAVLTRASALARVHASAVDVSTDLRVGAAAQVLIAASAESDLVVVGSRGLGGFAGLLLGSVSAQVSAHAHCPTVVVRGEPPTAQTAVEQTTAGPVVVGVDGSEPSHAALAFAFAEASRLGAPVLAVHAWSRPMPTGTGEAAAVALAGGDDSERYRQVAQQVLTTELAGYRQRLPDVPVQELLPEGTAAAALLEAAGNAAMIVVGSRGHGGFTGLLLGSTSQSVLHHASCPVVVVRAK